MNLPVEDVEKAIPFYETVMGFQVRSRSDSEDPKFSIETFEGGYSYKVFFVVAPDGLCYCIGEPQNNE
jgi:predicted enzyme related to lactoylglutathione lyase